MSDLNLVFQLIQTLGLIDLKKCKSMLDSLVIKACSDKEQDIKSKVPKDFVEYDANFLSPPIVEYQTVNAELISMNLKPKTNSHSPVSTWLTSTNQPYSWTSAQGTRVTTKPPLDINDYPAIGNLLNSVNTTHNTDLNSCLVCYYETGKCFSSFHDDGEDSLDPESPIVVVSLGGERTVEFIHPKEHRNSDKPLYSIKPADGSKYVMKKGCQDFFKHGVKKDGRIKKGRFCLSFRKMIVPNANTQSDNASNANAASATSSASLSNSVSDIIDQYQKGQLSPVTDNLTTHGLGSSSSNATSPSSHKVRKRTTVLFGTSITKRIRSSQIGQRGRKFVNLSVSGAKIRDIRKSVLNFRDQHASASDVEKIILSFGTNDIKYSRKGVKHLKHFVTDLVSDCKRLFPDAIILIQSCLPIRNMYWYTAPNVLNFNRLLNSVCCEFNCIYLDCFRYFLCPDLRDHNRNLFYDWLHLNDEGLGILCRWLKFVVNQSSFNNVLYTVP